MWVYQICLLSPKSSAFKRSALGSGSIIALTHLVLVRVLESRGAGLTATQLVIEDHTYMSLLPYCLTNNQVSASILILRLGNVAGAAGETCQATSCFVKGGPS